MAKKSFIEKSINRKVGGAKRSLKASVGLRKKSSKGCLLTLVSLALMIGFSFYL